jgi:hypothetical protein
MKVLILIILTALCVGVVAGGLRPSPVTEYGGQP